MSIKTEAELVATQRRETISALYRIRDFREYLLRNFSLHLEKFIVNVCTAEGR